MANEHDTITLYEWVPALAKEIHKGKWSPNLDFVTHLQAQYAAKMLGIIWANVMSVPDVNVLKIAVRTIYEGK